MNRPTGGFRQNSIGCLQNIQDVCALNSSGPAIQVISALGIYSGRMTGKAEVIGSSVGLVPTNAHLFSGCFPDELPTSRYSSSELCQVSKELRAQTSWIF